MTPRVGDLDGMGEAEARELLRACGAAPRWVEGMIARRPFGSLARLRAAADEVWATLKPDDWRAAFAHHPRIGARVGVAAQGARDAVWSAGEQAGVASGDAAAREALDAVNQEYEARFGHIYIVCATGKSVGELLGIARSRLANDPARELAVAGEELRQIMQLRLAKALTSEDGAPG